MIFGTLSSVSLTLSPEYPGIDSRLSETLHRISNGYLRSDVIQCLTRGDKQLQVE